MNFFAHFLVDHQSRRDSYNAALIAPDLFRHFLPENNRFPWEKLTNDPQIIESGLVDFCLGSIQHIQSDKKFHQSNIFNEIYHSQRSSWQQLGEKLQVGRWWFSLHVSMELVLDKILIENNLQLLNAFYITLEKEKKTYLQFLELFNHPSINLFSERFDKFIESQYLFHYQTESGITYALHRIHQSLSIPTPWYPNHANEISNALHLLENHVLRQFSPQRLLIQLKA